MTFIDKHNFLSIHLIQKLKKKSNSWEWDKQVLILRTYKTKGTPETSKQKPSKQLPRPHSGFPH